MTKKKLAAKPSDDFLEPVDPPPAPAAARVLHVNGKEIPEHLLSVVAFALTDEGIEEANKNRVQPSGVKVTRDSWDKQMDSRANAIEAWEAADPAKEAVEKYGRAGFANRLLSQSVVSKKGLRGWEPVIAPNGDPVRVANMILGEMPQESKTRRNAHYAQLAREQQESAVEANQEAQERLLRDPRSEGISLLRAGESVTNHEDPDSSVSVGIHRTRGIKGQQAA